METTQWEGETKVLILFYTEVFHQVRPIQIALFPYSLDIPL